MVRRCGNKTHCPICVERGLRADHRPGDPSACEVVPLRWSVKAHPGGRRSLHLAPEGDQVEGQRGKGGTSAPGEDLSLLAGS